MVEILTEALRDKNERVRRRVMATLGELLFYIATQQQDGAAGSVSDAAAAWGITSATTGGVARLLRCGARGAGRVWMGAWLCVTVCCCSPCLI